MYEYYSIIIIPYIYNIVKKTTTKNDRRGGEGGERKDKKSGREKVSNKRVIMSCSSVLATTIALGA